MMKKVSRKAPIGAIATIPQEFSSLTPEDIAINRRVAKRLGTWEFGDWKGAAITSERHAFARQTTLVRVKAHDSAFGHHSHLATDFVAGEAL